MAVIRRYLYRTVRDNRKKTHTCIGCGKEYSYTMTREEKLRNPNATASDLDPFFERDCDVVPCPHCGLYQAEMVDKVRLGGFGTGHPLTSALILSMWAVIFTLLLSFSALVRTVSVAWLGMVLWSVFNLLRRANRNPNSGTERTARGMSVPGGEGAFTGRKKVLYALAAVAAAFSVLLPALALAGAGGAFPRVIVFLVSAVSMIMCYPKFIAAVSCGQFPGSFSS